MGLYTIGIFVLPINIDIHKELLLPNHLSRCQPCIWSVLMSANSVTQIYELCVPASTLHLQNHYLPMSASIANAKPEQAESASKPVDVLQSQSSQFYVNLHPILLLSIVLFSFKTLVNDPVNTLLGLAPATAILQAIYCVVCLPSTGQTPPAPHKPGQKKKTARPEQAIWAKFVVRSHCTSLPNEG